MSRSQDGMSFERMLTKPLWENQNNDKPTQKPVTPLMAQFFLKYLFNPENKEIQIGGTTFKITGSNGRSISIEPIAVSNDSPYLEKIQGEDLIYISIDENNQQIVFKDEFGNIIKREDLEDQFLSSD